MRFNLSSFVLIAAVLFAAPAARAQFPSQSIIENGNFDNPTDPLKGWVTDYAWAGNSNYMGNKDHISVGTEGARKVAKFGDAGNAGVKMESRAFPLEPGYKYTCTLDIKSGGYRIYLAGYQWMPGTHPHDNPELGELRMVYQSKTSQGASDAWKHEKMELPGITLSSAAIEHLKKVRFLTVYIYMLKPGAVSNVVVTKTPDPTMKFE